MPNSGVFLNRKMKDVVAAPEKNKEGKWAYDFTTKSGLNVKFVLDPEFTEEVRKQYEKADFPEDVIAKELELVK